MARNLTEEQVAEFWQLAARRTLPACGPTCAASSLAAASTRPTISVARLASSCPSGVLGVLAAIVSAALALSAFWPRRFPILEPSPLRRYLRAEQGFTRLTVLDSLEDFVNESSVLPREKGRRLGWGLERSLSPHCSSRPVSLKGYIERDNKPDATADQKDERAPAR